MVTGLTHVEIHILVVSPWHHRNVQQISATVSAFAAVVVDGHVVTWGDADLGGDSTGVQDQLVHVSAISATSGAFAAMADGHVVTWR